MDKKTVEEVWESALTEEVEIVMKKAGKYLGDLQRKYRRNLALCIIAFIIALSLLMNTLFGLV